jgi:hypothetical protein
VIQLTRRGDGTQYDGVLPTFTVVDARGNLAGWVVTLSATSSARDDKTRGPLHLRIQADEPSIIAGLPQGLEAGKNAYHSKRDAVVLCQADAPWGGGTYSCGGTIEVKLARGTADHPSVTLVAEVH